MQHIGHANLIRPEDAEIERGQYVWPTEYGDVTATPDPAHEDLFRLEGCTRYHVFAGFWNLSDGVANVLVMIDPRDERTELDAGPYHVTITSECYTFGELYKAICAVTGDIE